MSDEQNKHSIICSNQDYQIWKLSENETATTRIADTTELILQWRIAKALEKIAENTRVLKGIVYALEKITQVVP